MGLSVPSGASVTGPIEKVELRVAASNASESEIEAKILELVERRGQGKTICPSEVARELDDDGFRELLAPVRAVAGGLARRGEIVVTQSDREVEATEATGPIRLGLPGPGSVADR